MGWPSPHLAGSDVLSVEAGMNDTTKHACLTGVADLCAVSEAKVV